MASLKEQTQVPYKCFIDKKCSYNSTPKTLVCINCGNAFHNSCFSKLKNLKHIKKFLVDCCNKNNDINSSVASNSSTISDNFNSSNLEENYKKNLADLEDYKQKLIELTKVNKKISSENKILVEDMNALHRKMNNNEELVALKQQFHGASEKLSSYSKEITKLNDIVSDLKKQITVKNETIKNSISINEKLLLEEIIASKVSLCESLQNTLSNTENSFINENKLLKDLNESLQINNKLLTEKIQLLETKNENINVNSINSNKIKSYSEVLSKNTKNIEYHKPSNIIIKCIDNNLNNNDNSNSKFNDLNNLIKPDDTNVKINYTKILKNGSILINCDDDKTKTTVEELVSKNTNKYKIQENKLRQPAIKIVGLSENFKGESYDIIETAIKKQNFKDVQGDFKINHIYTNPTNNLSTIYATCSPEIFLLLKNNTRIYLGMRAYKVFEDFGLSRCKKCCAYGHSIKNCLNPFLCSFCAGNHSSDKCNNKSIMKCLNCCFSNDNHKTKFKTSHYAHDIEKCSTYKKLKVNKINITKYVN